MGRRARALLALAATLLLAAGAAWAAGPTPEPCPDLTPGSEYGVSPLPCYRQRIPVLVRNDEPTLVPTATLPPTVTPRPTPRPPDAETYLLDRFDLPGFGWTRTNFDSVGYSFALATYERVSTTGLTYVDLWVSRQDSSADAIQTVADSAAEAVRDFGYTAMKAPGIGDASAMHQRREGDVQYYEVLFAEGFYYESVTVAGLRGKITANDAIGLATQARLKLLEAAR